MRSWKNFPKTPTSHKKILQRTRIYLFKCGAPFASLAHYLHEFSKTRHIFCKYGILHANVGKSGKSLQNYSTNVKKSVQSTNKLASTYLSKHVRAQMIKRCHFMQKNPYFMCIKQSSLHLQNLSNSPSCEYLFLSYSTSSTHASTYFHILAKHDLHKAQPQHTMRRKHVREYLHSYNLCASFRCLISN